MLEGGDDYFPAARFSKNHPIGTLPYAKSIRSSFELYHIKPLESAGNNSCNKFCESFVSLRVQFSKLLIDAIDHMSALASAGEARLRKCHLF